MGLLITKEWLLDHVPIQIKEVDIVISKLNTKIKESRQKGLFSYTWEAYEIEDELIKEIDKTTLDLVVKDIKEAGYDVEVECKEPLRRTRVVISWKEKPLEPPEPKLPEHLPIIPPPIKVENQITQQNDRFKTLEEYERLLAQYQRRLDMYIQHNKPDKAAEFKKKIEETEALKSALLASMGK